MASGVSADPFAATVAQDMQIHGYTINDVIEIIGMGFWHWRLLCLFGTYWAWISATAVSIPWMLLDMQKELQLSSYECGVIASGQLFGQVGGKMLCGYLSHRFGTRRTVIFSAVGLSICQGAIALCSCASQVVVLCVAKSMLYALISLLTKNLFAEVLPIQNRGAFLNLLHVTWQFGGLFVTGLSFVSSDFRLLALMTAAPGLLLVLAASSMPESPRWLLKRHGSDVATKALADIATQCGASTKLPPFWEIAENGELTQRPEKERRVGCKTSAHSQDPSLLSILTQLCRAHLRSTFLTLLAMFLFLQYASQGTDAWLLAFLTVRGKADLRQPLSFLQFGFKMLGGCCSVLLVDKLGRRKLLQACFAGASLALATLAVVTGTIPMCVSIACLYFCTEQIWATIATYASEVFPAEARNSAVGLVMGLSLFGGVISTLTTPALMNVHVSLPFGMYAVAFVLGAFASSLLTIETGGKALA